jgi:hypothetical protein
MSKADRLKEELSWLRVVYAILVAIDVSLIAWFAQHYDTADLILSVLCWLAIVLASAAIVWVTRQVYRKLDELEEL